MNKFLRVALAIMLATGVYAQPGTFITQNVLVDYDLDSTTEVFAATGNVGATADAGVFPVSRYNKFTVLVSVTQSDATGGIDSRLLCRANGASSFLQIYPELIPGATAATYVNIATTGPWGVEVEGAYSDCKVGMLIHTSDPSDSGSNVEKVSISVSARS